eukprot:jgi/Chrzof1/12189/Cz06g24150.t1
MTRLRRFLACFGNGQFGRLGHGPETDQIFPKIVSTLAGSHIKQVSCGGAHTAVVTDDGCLFTFGINDKGQLGHSDDCKWMGVPTEVILPDTIQAVAAAEHHTLALSSSGEVWSSGTNAAGQLGLGKAFGTRNSEFRLVRALQGRRVVQLAAGNEHSLALTDTGQVYAWGYKGYGALGWGHAHKGVVSLPAPVEGLTGLKIKSIAAGAFHSGCVDADGNVYVWGHGAYGQLGLGTYHHYHQPHQVMNVWCLMR